MILYILIQSAWTHNIAEAVFTDPPVSHCVIQYCNVCGDIHPVVIKVVEVQQLFKECDVPQSDTSKIIDYLKVTRCPYTLYVQYDNHSMYHYRCQQPIMLGCMGNMRSKETD